MKLKHLTAKLPTMPWKRDKTTDAPVDPDVPEISTWTNGSELPARAATVGLFVALACGPIALGIGAISMLSSPESPPAVAAADPNQDTDRIVAADVATLAVDTWLTTPRGAEQEHDWMPQFVASPQPTEVADLHASDATHRGGSTWEVTVSGTVTEHPAEEKERGDNEEGRDQGGKDDKPTKVRRWWVVPVQITGPVGDRHGVVMALPAAVAGPQMTPGDKPKNSHRVALNDPAGQAVIDFLNALAAGSGDITRYSSPGHTIAAITPAPYTEVEVLNITTDFDGAEPTAGVTQNVVVDAAGITANGAKHQMTYALTLAARDGRWEVQSMNPAIPETETTTDPKPTTPTPESTPTP